MLNLFIYKCYNGYGDGMKKKWIILVSFILIVLVVISLFLFKENDPYKEKGYSDEEIEIISKLDKQDQEKILSYSYIEISKLVTVNGYRDHLFMDYIKYSQEHSDLSFDDVVSTLNQEEDQKKKLNEMSTLFGSHEQYQSERLERYIEYYQKHDGISTLDTVLVVNADVDMYDVAYDEFLIQLIQEPYFIVERVSRYMNYYNSNGYDASSVISHVNSNLDYDYYTNIQDTDLSKDTLMLVNKYYKLPSNYEPDDLVTIESNYGHYEIRSVAYENMKKMIDDASKEGMHLYAASPYRSYQTQYGLYNSYASSDGYANADRYSARAGHSEHQTGLAIDFITPGGSLGSFVNSMEYSWMLDNCYKYGFILRYTYGKEHITGYVYEPWHYRYVGVDVATKIHEKDITFEEYYAYYLEEKE